MGNKSGVARQGLNANLYATKTYVDDAILDASTSGQTLTVEAGSTQYLDITNDEISIKALAVTDVITDSTVEPDFSTWYTNNFTTVDAASGPIEEGDILILTSIDSKTELWIHNGGITDTVTDFTQIQNNNIDDAYIRTLLSGVNGLTYNSVTGEFKLGGTLTENTGIDLSSNTLNLGTTSEQLSVTDSGVSFKTFTNTDGVILPSGTTAQRSVSPTNGEFRYNDELGHAEIYEEGEWTRFPINIEVFNSIYVDGNNPNTGDGSVTNPYKTIDSAYNYIIGSGSALNPDIAGKTIRVLAGTYTTSLNIAINSTIYYFEEGADVTYTGSAALFNLDSTVTSNTSNTTLFILGLGRFRSSTGGIVFVQGILSFSSIR